jgi:hypothetical protein
MILIKMVGFFDGEEVGTYRSTLVPRLGETLHYKGLSLFVDTVEHYIEGDALAEVVIGVRKS